MSQMPPPPYPGQPQPYPGQPPMGVPAAPQPKSRRNAIVVASVIGGFLLLCGCAGLVAVLSGGSEEPGDDTGGVTTQTTGEAPTSGELTRPRTPDTPGLGQPVRDGKFEFVVHSVRCGVPGVGDQYFGEHAQGQFCLVAVTVKNIGSEAQLLDDSNQRAYDAKGREYQTDTLAGLHANQDNEVWLNEINPGNQVKGNLVFDIPKHVKLTRLELHDSAFSGGVEVKL